MKRCIIICSLKVILFMVFFVYLTVADSDTPIENPESLKDVVVGQNEEISSLPEVVLPYIVRKAQKSIVSISAIKGKEVIGFDNEGNPSFKERIIGTASGIIINSEGYILTYRGAIANNPERIEVILHPEEKAIEVKVVGWNKRTDLAVLKMDSLIPLSPATLGDSDKIQTGEEILTLGYSGKSLIVTTGRISARRLNAANLPLGSINTDIIPVDATITSGSTGGALVNMKGEVIGVLYLRTEGEVGEGFCCAIPINSAKPLIDRLIKLGRVASGWLGVVIEDIKPELAKSLGLPDLNGVFVKEVFPDTPAEKAGLKVEDVIRSFDGKEVKSSSDLIMTVATTDVGKRVKVLIIRDKSEKEIEIEVWERPGEKENVPIQKSEIKQEVPVLGDVPLIGNMRRDTKKDESGSGYALTVESDGDSSFLLRFPPNSESEVAGSIDQIFQNRTRLDIQFAPGVDPSSIQKLEEYMHDRNFTISTRVVGTEDGPRVSIWTLHKGTERIQIYIQKAESRQTYRKYRSKIYSGRITDLGKHIQSGELKEANTETKHITLYFSEEGKSYLKNIIVQKLGEKLFLYTEGVMVGEGEVPQDESNTSSLTFTLSPDKLKRLEHAFEMSKLQLKIVP